MTTGPASASPIDASGPDGGPLLLDRPQVRSLVTTGDARRAVSEALTALADSKAVLPDELAMALPAGEVHVKGGHLLGSPHAAFKVACGFPDNAAAGLPVNDGFTLVLDAGTGSLLAALLDHGWLTDVRTGAAGAVAAEHLARPDARSVALIGAGAQARFQLEALLEVRLIESVAVWNRTPERAERLAADLGSQYGLACRAEATPQEAVRDAHIVVTTTASRRPLLRHAWLSPGTHVTAVGADFPDKQELHPDVLGDADVVVADDVATCSRVGELHHALEAGSIDRGRVVALADVVAGTAAGRTSRDQITVADQCGLGVYDAAMADLVLARHGAWA